MLRLIITPKDVEVILGVSSSYARRVVRIIKRKNNKEKHQEITVLCRDRKDKYSDELKRQQRDHDQVVSIFLPDSLSDANEYQADSNQRCPENESPVVACDERAPDEGRDCLKSKRVIG